MPSPSNNYNAIKGMIAARKPIYAKYKGEANKRTLCPHVLGYKKSDSDETDELEERVLCYQVDGPPPVQGWRSFDLSELVLVPPHPTTGFQGPKYSKWQNDVQKAKHWVPYP